MMAVKIDSSGEAAASATKDEKSIGMLAMPLNDAWADGDYAISMILAAEMMVERISDSYGVDQATQRQLYHLKNLLVVTGERMKAALDTVDTTHSLLLQTRGCA